MTVVSIPALPCHGREIQVEVQVEVKVERPTVQGKGKDPPISMGSLRISAKCSARSASKMSVSRQANVDRPHTPVLLRSSSHALQTNTSHLYINQQTIRLLLTLNSFHLCHLENTSPKTVCISIALSTFLSLPNPHLPLHQTFSPSLKNLPTSKFTHN